MSKPNNRYVRAYRVIRYYDKGFGGFLYRIADVYFVSGEVYSYSWTSIGSSETIDGILADIELIKQALSKPVIEDIYEREV